MKALFLLGGEGKRLRPFTVNMPKSLLPVANEPLIMYQLALVKKYGVKEAVFGTGPNAGDFREAVASGKKEGVNISVSIENVPLGTGGGIKNACKKLADKEGGPFIVINGDILADFNIEKMLSFHREKSAGLTIGLVKVPDPSPYGLVITGEGMKVEKFVEKPSRQEVISDTVNAGIYIFNSMEDFNKLQSGKEISLEKEVIPSMISEGKPVYGYVHYGYWLDVGTLESYRKASFDILEGRFRPDYFNQMKMSSEVRQEPEGRISTGKGAFIDESVRIKGNVIVGQGCFIGPGTVLENSIILNDSAIISGSAVADSIIGREVYIGEGSDIRNVFIADKSLLRGHTCMNCFEKKV